MIRPVGRISLPGMNRFETLPQMPLLEFHGGRELPYVGLDRPVSHLPPLAGRPASGGGRAIFHLAVEAEDPRVLEHIRAALPEGCRLHIHHVSMDSFDASRSSPLTQKNDPSGLPDLTARQRHILALLLEGLSNKEIGRRLALSHFTVRNHISQILRLLQVSSRKDAIARFAGGSIRSDPVALSSGAA